MSYSQNLSDKLMSIYIYIYMYIYIYREREREGEGKARELPNHKLHKY